MSIASPSVRPSPLCRRVGIRDFTFEACSGFTRVTARRVAQPPKAAFVTRLRSGQLPNQTARQLPDLSTTIWVDSASTGYPCLCGAHSEIRDGLWSADGSLQLLPSRRAAGSNRNPGAEGIYVSGSGLPPEALKKLIGQSYLAESFGRVSR